MNNKVLSMIALAKKAGKVKSGEFSTEKSIKEGKACLVIVAEDASMNTKKLFTNKCSFYKVPLEIYSSKLVLGQIIGCESRASLVVEDENFGREIRKRIDMQKNMEV